jgi:hypothetical protein
MLRRKLVYECDFHMYDADVHIKKDQDKVLKVLSVSLLKAHILCIYIYNTYITHSC